MKKKQFELTRYHLTMLRHMRIGWQNAEYGAPEIDSKRPFGNSNVREDLRKLFELPRNEWGEAELNRLEDVYHETDTALQIVLATGKFESGWYSCDEYDTNWTKI